LRNVFTQPTRQNSFVASAVCIGHNVAASSLRVRVRRHVTHVFKDQQVVCYYIRQVNGLKLAEAYCFHFCVSVSVSVCLSVCAHSPNQQHQSIKQYFSAALMLLVGSAIPLISFFAPYLFPYTPIVPHVHDAHSFINSTGFSVTSC